jgi:hypothetical protein
MVPRRARRRSLIQLAGGAALGALVPARTARAAPLSPEEVARLAAGEVVRVPLDLDLPQGSYFGGLSYAVVRAPVAEVTAVLNDPSTYTSILPKTLESRVLRSGERDRQVYLRHGGRAGSAAYVLTVRRESMGMFRFWLDPSQPHEIADLWGYFRVQPWDKEASLATYAALLRLDFGVVKMLFSEVIRRYALSTPGLLRDFVHAHGHEPSRERETKVGAEQPPPPSGSGG